MRKPLVILLALLWVYGAAAWVSAADGLIPRDDHPWGSFGVGSWKRVRTITETPTETGGWAPNSTSETTTTLTAVGDQTYCIRVEMTMEIGGRKIASQPQFITQGYSGEAAGQAVSIKTLGDRELTINQQRFPSQLREITIKGDDLCRTSLIHYSPEVAPFVLRRTTTATDPERNITAYETDVEVLALDMPYRVVGELRNVSYVRTTTKSPKGGSVTLEVNCDDVPGGVVAHSSKEVDPTGKVLRRSTLELVDYLAKFEPPPAPASPPAAGVAPKPLNPEGSELTWKMRRQQRRAQRMVEK